MQYATFAKYYDAMMHDVDYDGWAVYIDSLIKQYNGENSVLDCACGTGNITVRLSEYGYSAIGSDCSTEMLQVAQQKARNGGMNIHFICQRLQELSLHKPIGVVNCSCDGVNYLCSREEVRSFFAAAWNCLRHDGLLLFDISSRYKLEHILADSFMGEDTEDYSYLWQNSYDAKSKLQLMELTFFVREGDLFRKFKEEHLQRAHSIDEIKSLLEECGFILEAVFEAFTNKEPKEDSQRIQFVARKKNNG